MRSCEYVHCGDVKIRTCEDVRVLVARDRQGMLYEKCQKYKHTDMLIGSQTQTHAEKHVYTCIHADTHRHTHKPTHAETFTRISLYKSFTHIFFLHTDVFTHKIVTHKAFFLNIQTCLHTQIFLHTENFTHRSFYTQSLLHTDVFTHRRFYTQKF